MNEKYKAKLAKLKEQTEKYAPVIIPVALGAGGAIGWYLAGRYKQQLIELRLIDEDAWPTVAVHPDLMGQVMEGAILKVRKTRGTQSGLSGNFVQMTIRDEFSDEQNETFDEVQSKSPVR
jgi:hypothetical protein